MYIGQESFFRCNRKCEILLLIIIFKYLADCYYAAVCGLLCRFRLADICQKFDCFSGLLMVIFSVLFLSAGGLGPV